MPSDTKYLFNEKEGVLVKGCTQSLFIDLDVFKKALHLTNLNMDNLKENVPELFGILGMRNLSAFVGEMFVSSLVKSSEGKLVKNPHQDGYPDLLIMSGEGRELWEKLKDNNQDKSPFSGFETGGMEVKATCGSLPTPAVFRKKGLRKPEIGDERINHIMGYDWKAHHRETNNLIGIYWDFVDKKPVICGVFFCGDLTENDWGKIVQPKEGGGRTTSVSIMTRDGILNMYKGWLAVIDDKRYINLFDRFNRSSSIGDLLIHSPLG